MGNFSGNTFDELKNYVSVRLQQGVPLLDVDWNELDDIRRGELRNFLKWFVGDGIPKGNDGFHIQATATPSNDFSIETGRCLVNGWEVSNPGKLLYSKQELEDESADPLPPLLKPIPIDMTIYLDVWEREVEDSDNPVYNVVGIDSSVRLKREWVVRWITGNFTRVQDFPASAIKSDHGYYILATIKRGIPNPNNIYNNKITDLRKTIFADFVWPSEITIKNGKVGIGTTDPQSPLHVAQSLTVGPFAAPGSPGKLFVDGAGAGLGFAKRALITWPASPAAGDRFEWYNQGGTARLWTDIKGDLLTVTSKGNVIIGTPGPEDNFLLEVAGRMKVRGDQATGTAGIWFAQSYGFGERAFVGLFNDNHIGFWGNTGANWGLLMNTATGNVGIGTSAAKNKLDVEGGAVIGAAYSGTNTAPANGLLVEGNVGIGTASPANKLSVEADEFFRATIYSHVNYSNHAGDLQLGFSRGTGAAPSAVLNGDAIGYLEFVGFDGASYRTGAFIKATVQENFTSTKHGTDLRFYTCANGSSSPVTRMTIRHNGNVGIGTIDPGNDMLDVRGRCYSSGGWQTTNGDYAEYFESEDGTAIPSATPVVLTNKGKIRAAKKDEAPIGITTQNSAVVGNSYKEWPQKYLRDKYGQRIMEKVKEEIMVPKKEKVKKERQKTKKRTIEEEAPYTDIVYKNKKYCQVQKTKKVKRQVEELVFEEFDLFDSTGKNKIGKHRIPVMETYTEEVDVLDKNGEPVLVGSGKFVTVEQPKLNPKYNEKKEYIPRSERNEWSCVGLLGQLVMRKDKTVAPTWVKIKDLPDDMELWLVK